MTQRCGTRALKNARHIHAVAPHVVSSDTGAEGFGTGIPIDLLAVLHKLPVDHPDVAEHGHVVRALGHDKLPVPRRRPLGPLFHGTIHFVHVTFETPDGAFAVPDADMRTIVRYARRAVVPISAYAAQYGPNRVHVSREILRHHVRLAHDRFGDAQVRTWVDDIVRNEFLPLDAALAIVAPDGVSAADVSANCGYHGLATVPYTVIGVHDTALTLRDLTDSYAMAVSHELAELVVDPRGDHHNPEVCDPCDLNCGSAHRAYFDEHGEYMGSAAELLAAFRFAFYTCAVVKPAGAGRCPAPAGDCEYAP